MSTVMLFTLLVWSVGAGVQGSVLQASRNNDSGQFELTIRMPNATSDRPDALVCHAYKLPEKEAYILRVIPHATQKVARHMVIYGCSEPGTHKPFWPCPRHDNTDPELAVCGSGQLQLVFTWANDATSRNFPHGVGLRVGGTTGIDYFVLQLHYVKAFGEEAADRSGMTLVMTYEKQPQQVGYYVLGNIGNIPPQNPEFHMEAACTVDLNYTIYPIGYRTHGHSLAVVSSGYRIRDGVWTELGRMSPHRPQTFYNVTSAGVDVRNGDVLASRCTFNSMSRTKVTKIGPAETDDMCLFYILYTTYEQKDLNVSFCVRRDNFAWSDFFNLTPADASSLNGIPGAGEISRQFHTMDPRYDAK